MPLKASIAMNVEKHLFDQMTPLFSETDMVTLFGTEFTS
jgi:hypothetical protein